RRCTLLTGAPMPLQRKVFRIEESTRARLAKRNPAADGDPAKHQQISLRGLIEPQADFDRPAREWAQAQIAEAQTFRRELELIHAAVERSRGEAGIDSNSVARTKRELAAIVAGTERATQSILQAAEEIDHAAGTLSAALKSSHDKGLAHDIQDRVVQI